MKSPPKIRRTLKPTALPYREAAPLRIIWPLSTLPSLLSERKREKSHFAPNGQEPRGSFGTTSNCNRPRSFVRETIDPGNAEKGYPMPPDSTVANRARGLPHTHVATAHRPRGLPIPS